MSEENKAIAKKTPVDVGARGMVPKNFDETVRIAGTLFRSNMIPKSFDTPEKVMVAMMQGMEVGFSPVQSLQHIAVINGKPTIWGDGLMALARRGGNKVFEEVKGENEDMVACCSITRADNDEVIERCFSVNDAKKAGLWGKKGPWQSYPKRMLQRRARGWAVRDGLADQIGGFAIAEEVMDTPVERDVTPKEIKPLNICLLYTSPSPRDRG